MDFTKVGKVGISLVLFIWKVVFVFFIFLFFI